MLEGLVIPGSQTLDVRSQKDVAARLLGTISSKQYGRVPLHTLTSPSPRLLRAEAQALSAANAETLNFEMGARPDPPRYEKLLAELVAKACIDVCPPKASNFSVESVRICKIVGGGLTDSTVVQGLVLRRNVEGTITKLTDAKVAVFGCALDTSSTETKGTVLIRSAQELEGYAEGEENKIEAAVKAVAATGARVVVTGSSVGEMALHFLEKYNLMVIKIPSKFELRRFCKTVNAVALINLVPPTADELGFVSHIAVEEIGGSRCIVARQADATSAVATVVIRGATDNAMDDVERAVDDGVNAYKCLVKDSRTVAGGGATEIELALQLAEFGRKETGLEQYAIAKYAQALEVVPRTLAENAGLNATDVITQLYAAHAAGQKAAGVDVEGGGPKDLASEASICDIYGTKWWALKLALDAVIPFVHNIELILNDYQDSTQDF